MLSRILILLCKRVFQTFAVITLGLILLFFALTRTQVGRDSLATQLERSFAARYNGQLEISRLTGNLLNSLYADDVAILSANRDTVAFVDSIIVEPHWSALLRRSFSVRSVQLISPDIRLSTVDSTLTNIDELFDPTPADSEQKLNPHRWSFSSAHIEVLDGRLESSLKSPTALPSRLSWLVHLKEQTVEDIQLSATLDWREDRRQVDVISLSAHLATVGLPLHETRAQIHLTDSALTLTSLVGAVGRSRVTMNGWLSLSRQQSVPMWKRAFSAEVESATFDLTELQRLFPGLSSTAIVRVAARIDGPFSSLTIPWLNVESGDSQVFSSGTVVGYPDSLDVEYSIDQSMLSTSDMLLLFPDMESLRLGEPGPVSIDAYIRGTVTSIQRRMFRRMESTVSIESDGGSANLEVLLDGPLGDSLRHNAMLTVERVNPRLWLGTGTPSGSVSGTTRLRGLGTDPARLTSHLTANFEDIRLGSSTADNIYADLDILSGGISGDVGIVENGGRLLLSGEAGIRGRPKRLSAALRFEDSDVGPLLGIDSLETRLSGKSEFEASYLWNDSFRVSMAADLDSSRVTVSDSTEFVIPQHAHLEIRPPSPSNPEIEILSDILDVEVESDTAIPLLLSAVRSWVLGVRSTISDERSKYLYRTASREDSGNDLNNLLALETARQRYGNKSPSQVTVSTRVKHPELLHAFWPESPRFSGRGDAESNITLGPDTLAVALTFSSDSLQIRGIGSGSLDVEGSQVVSRVNLGRNPGITQASSFDMAANIRRVATGGQSLSETVFNTSYADRRGTLTVASGGGLATDSIRISADTILGADRNSVLLRTLTVETESARWGLEEQTDLDFYADATRVRDFNLIHTSEGVPTGQSISADGTFSARSSDRLEISMNEVILHQFSTFLEMNHPVGGRVNTDLIFTGGRENPQVSGRLDIHNFSVDERILGDILLDSRFVAGRSDVAVDFQLTPAQAGDNPVIAGTSMAADVVPNELSFEGEIQLPSLDGESAGRLDLAADVRRADLFFFKYIFNEVLGEVSGFGTGSGSISGTFFQPLFDVDVEVTNGAFEVPIINESYSIESDVHIDSIGIHLIDTTVQEASGGSGVINGVLHFNEYRNFTLDLQGDVDELRIMNVADSDQLPFYGFLWVSGSFELTGPTYNATLTSSDAVTRNDSELFVPVVEETSESDNSFIVFEDSLGYIPDFKELAARPFLLSSRPEAERQFLDGLNLDLGIYAPPGSTIHLVIDPLLGDVINAVSTGRVQLQRVDGEFLTFGQLQVNGGDYLFTAGEVFVRRFLIQPGGTITWDGDPINARLDIPAAYRTRASLAGLPGSEDGGARLVPLVVNLQISGTVVSPQVDLSLAIDRSNQNVLGDYQGLEAQLNQPDRATEYATSVLLTNSFQLTTDNIGTGSGSQLAFNSLSQLVSSQLNRFLNEALPNVDFSFGLQGENAQDLDVTYGVALRLLDERLIIRGEGIYQGTNATDQVRTNEGLQGEFVVEIRLNQNVSIEVFFRREGDILETTELTNTAGAGVSFQTEFVSWKELIGRFFGRSGDSR